MEEQHSEQQEPKKKKGKDRALIVIIILLLLLSGFLGWKVYQQDNTIQRVVVEKERTEEKKKELKGDLQKMLDEYNDLEVDNDSLRKKVEKEKKKIKELMDKVDRYQYSLSKAKEESKTLRKIMKGYVHEIDSLHQINDQLEAENKNIKSELGTVKTQREQLESKTKDLEKDLEVASSLKTSNMRANAIRINLLGNPKVTERANRAEKIKTCFTVNENPLAKEGNRELYIRIINPEGQVLSEGEDGKKRKFEFQGVRGQYTLKHTIQYKKREKDLCLFWGMGDEDLPEGKYGVKVYEGQRLIGSTNLKLK